MIVVSNTTPLIGLASVQQFDLLRQLFGEIRIPEAVYHEAVVQGREAGGAKREVSEADWVKMVEVKDQLAVEVLLDELDRGEAETIVLARELEADWVLMDERKGRRKLTQLGMQRSARWVSCSKPSRLVSCHCFNQSWNVYALRALASARRLLMRCWSKPGSCKFARSSRAASTLMCVRNSFEE